MAPGGSAHAERTEPGCPRCTGVATSAEQHEQLLAYHALLMKWNKAYNLTAVYATRMIGLASPARQPQRGALRRGNRG